MIYRNIITLIAGVAFLCLSHNGVSQSLMSENIIQNDFHKSEITAPDGAIKVSAEIYSSILDWLEIDEEITIDEYLMRNTKNVKEVNEFLVLYYQGTYKDPSIIRSDRTKKSTTPQVNECVCKNIMPIDGQVAEPIQAADSDDDILDKDWNGQYHAWWYWASDGVAFDFTMDGSGNDIWEGDKQERQGYVQKIEILYLCSFEGERSEFCNCDKTLYMNGFYQKNLQTKTHTAGIAEVEISEHDAFYAFTAERNVGVDRNKFINVQEIAEDNEIRWETESRGVDFTQLKDALTNLYNAIVSIQDGDYESAIGTSVNFAQNLMNVVTFTQVGNGFQVNTNSIDVSHQPILRANIPRVFVYASNFTGHINGSGNEYRGEIRYSSNFYLDWNLPTQTAGYIPGSEVPSDAHDGECCNESLGKWIIRGSMSHYAFPSLTGRDAVIENAIQNDLNLNYLGQVNWAAANGASISGGVITSINSNLGNVFSRNRCGDCSAFEWGDRGDGIPNFWTPILTKSGSICDGAVTIYISNLSQLPVPSGVTLNIYIEQPGGGGYTLDQSFSSPSSPITLTAVGFYKFEFITGEGCRTFAFINIPECGAGSGDMDCYTNNTSISPNPLELGGEIEAVDVSWSFDECPDFVEKAPFHIVIYDGNGNVVFSTPASIMQSNGTLHIPVSNFPNPGIYIVRIQFNDSTFITKLLQVL